ncbi:HAD family hydrolase [Clostridium vincentii]|uniref:Bifunctional 5'-methylthioadenosine/S-adenosylhomocysteine nucleosidase/phosphatase n=1 Tax=Clostridium vincentii TaxID=52704 RepID=A0A2T0BDB3_9CLOT|nr:HAD family hydrolase [Clostridium vincentii]PRR81874.1 bifunctional 5'-methylthioadenosine/S-adenosylhomocysteine nucleosidase/phosphatase [Clostridium vincentii]
MIIDSIIFDLDGTMWDPTESIIDLWNETISKYDEVKNKLTVDDMKSIMGLVMQDVALKFFPYLEEENRLEIIEDCYENECNYLEKYGAILYDKLEDTLKELAEKYKLFIVSNCQCGYIEAFYKSHRLDEYFVDYESSGRTGLTKGENINLIIQRNNLINPIYVGDTAGDLKAARFSGIPFIYASYGFGEVEEYDYSLNSFDEILKFVAGKE